MSSSPLQRTHVLHSSAEQLHQSGQSAELWPEPCASQDEAQRIATQLGIAIVAPDTSPRGADVANDEGYDTPSFKTPSEQGAIDMEVNTQQAPLSNEQKATSDAAKAAESNAASPTDHPMDTGELLQQDEPQHDNINPIPQQLQDATEQATEATK